jgi:hypothetical protein
VDIYSYRTDSYRKWHDKLTPADQDMAMQAFLAWSGSEGATGRRLKTQPEVVSVKLNDGNRALGVDLGCPKPNALAVAWFFIGKHSDYEHFMKAARIDNTLKQIRDKMPAYRRSMEANKGLVKSSAAAKKPKL